MSARNLLLKSPPYLVEQKLKQLGANLRTARLRRNLTIHDVADKIGAGPRAVADAEKGKPSTSIATYVALLWAFDLLGQLNDVAAPDKDEEGKAYARAKERVRARHHSVLENDF